MNIFFDTEDNSETCVSRKDRQVTEIYALTETGEEFFNRGNVRQFLHWLATFGTCRVYAFNVMYDLGNLFADSLDSLDVTLVGGRLIKARWGPVEFLDVANIFSQTSVARLGEKFGLLKKNRNVKSKAYVKRDVDIIKKAMDYAFRFAAEKGIETLPATLGGLSVKIWNQKSCNWHDDSEFSRSALFGGRVELFRQGGEGNFHCADINSLYPFAMTKSFPCELRETKQLLEYGISSVEMKVPEGFVCPLPVRRLDGSIYFPFGKLTGTWTNHEIRNAVNHGAKIQRVVQSVGTNEAERFYADYIEDIYRERLAAKSEPEKLMLKLVMNNLYGQLGLRGRITRSLLLTEQDFDIEGNYIGGGIPYGRKHLVEQSIPLAPHVNYAHAAYVTSYGRLRLWEFLKSIPEKNLLYCDTDSVFFEDKAPFKFSDRLGEMKHVVSARTCKFVAPKFYRFGDETKAKGVPRNLAAEFFQQGSATFKRPYKLRQAVAFFDRGNIKQLSFWHEEQKFARTSYGKRLLKNGLFLPKKAVARDTEFCFS